VTGVTWEPLTVLGVDPGYRETGMALRQGDYLLGWTLVERTADEDVAVGLGVAVGPDYLEAVRQEAVRLLAEQGLENDPAVVLAVEGVRRPTGFSRGRHEPIDPAHLIGCALVAGAALASPVAAIRRVLVPPGGNGSGVLSMYPSALVTDRERRGGLNRPAGQSAPVRHCRSAWDVAGQGPLLARAARRAVAASTPAVT
jgi:hypothetical protein